MSRKRRADSGFVPCASALAVALALTGCSSAPTRDSRIERAPQAPKVAKATPPGGTFKRGGGYYLDDGPGDSPPPNLDAIPDAVPQLEPLKSSTMRPYVVMGQTYTPMTELTPYRAQGVASWYGRRYHGKQTSSGEIYDMYSMSAAHPLLPIPSYARVTNVANGKSVIVRVNDRGPFIDNRLIDVSYTAAYKLGVLAGGSAIVEVETIIPDASGPAGTAYARTPRAAPSQPRIALASAKPPAPTTAQLANEPDPILVIAAAAADMPGVATPLADLQAQPVVAPVPSRIAAADSGGIYLQLGAFGSRENAESYLARAKVQIEWLAQALHLFPRDGMFRVHAGPYSSSMEARQAAERVGLALGMKPVVVVR